MAMTLAALRRACRDHDLYQTPELNDRLYANFRGFTSLSRDLEAYSELSSLFLEGNALQSLELLPRFRQLKCLFLQQNALTSLASSPPLPTLVTLDVSNNPLETLEGLKQYPELRTLRATHTMLSNLDALADLQGCPHLESLDLSSSKLHASELLAYLAVATPQLRCLYLQGSPLASDLAHYRKRCIAALPRLQYLDDRPVSAKDRRCAEAWDRGGPEAEARERQLCLEEARAQLQGHASAFLRRGEGATLLGKDEEEEGAKSKAEPANSTLEVDADGEARGEAAAEHGGSWSASDEAPWPAKDASRVLPTTSTEIGEDEEAGSCSVGAPLSRADPSCCREPAEENVLRPRRPC